MVLDKWITQKAFNVEVEDEQEDQVSNFVAFTSQLEPTVDDNWNNTSEDEEEMTEEELLEDYKLLYTK
ncbi:hypothetical protein LIER_22851 [Lithospermum erythrorhizon]|uniref:Uncharacterized protein n=1 Tax=Lithospermum erythrorhizon TaxID=34254 RepID=A0AAV3QVH0_LITER